MNKEDIIKKYEMIPLDIEGGMWKGMFRSDEVIPEGVLKGREGEHLLYGSILYLLSGDSVSRMHRLVTDEIWHFYMGSSCELLVLCPDGTGYTQHLGHNIMDGEFVTAMVPRGCWQGVKLTAEDTDSCWALLGTTMAPGYENQDYEDGTESLLEEYPLFKDKILPLLARPQKK